jgi:hypothetical protein
MSQNPNKSNDERDEILCTTEPGTVSAPSDPGTFNNAFWDGVGLVYGDIPRVGIVTGDDLQLVRYFNQLDEISNSSATAEVKYDLIFQLHREKINPLLVALGISFEWYDPDTSYEEDVAAYLQAIAGLRANLGSLCEDGEAQ